MANTYTVTPWQNIEIEGDQFPGENINPVTGEGTFVDPWLYGNSEGKIALPTAYIDPKVLNNGVQYTVAAYNFRIGFGSPMGAAGEDGVANNGISAATTYYHYYNDYSGGLNNNVNLPENIQSVLFSDTGAPNTPGNRVKVQVFLQPGYTMPSNDVLFKIDINTYQPLQIWDPSVPSYRTTALLTNCIWPTKIDMPSIGGIISGFIFGGADSLTDTASQLDFFASDARKPITNYRKPTITLQDSSTYGENIHEDLSENIIDIVEDDSFPITNSVIPQNLPGYDDALVFYQAKYDSDNVWGDFVDVFQPQSFPLFDGWNNYEVKSRQNLFAIPYCVIYQVNSPIINAPPVATVPTSGNQAAAEYVYSGIPAGQGLTWASNDSSLGTFILDFDPSNYVNGVNGLVSQDGELHRVIKWRIKPSQPDVEVKAEDFSVMSWDVRTFEYTQAFHPGHADAATGNQCLNISTFGNGQWQNLVPNSSNSVGQATGNFPILCSFENNEGNVVTKWASDSLKKGFAYFYLDGIGGEADSDFTGDSNLNNTSCENCYGDLTNMSHHRYEYTKSEFDTFLGYGTYGTSFATDAQDKIYLYSKPKTFKSPQQADGPPINSTSNANYGTYIPFEPVYEIVGDGTLLQSTSTAYDRSSGSCGAGGNCMFKWVTFHDYTNFQGVNEVEVTGWLCPDFLTNPSADETYFLQINGLPRVINPQALPSIATSFDLESSYLNSGDITITPVNIKDVRTTVTETKTRGGFEDEKTIYNVSGNFPNDKPTVVATIKFEATKDSSDAYTHFFKKKPSLTRESIFKRLNKGLPDSIKMVLKSKVSNNSFTFDLIYNNNIKTTAADKLVAKLNFQQTPVITRTNDITRVDIGKKIIEPNGGLRKVTVYGRPGATFTLLINRIDEHVSSITGETVHENEYSILSAIANGGVEGPRTSSSFDLTGKSDIVNRSYPAIIKTIGASGKYSFTQKFYSVNQETNYNIYIKSTGDAYANLSGDILNWNKADYGRWPGYYVKTYNQFTNPVLTLKATVGSNYALTHVDGVAISPTPSSGDDYSATYTGIPNATRSKLKKYVSPAMTTDFTVTYLLNGASTKSFTNNRLPVFSSVEPFDGTGTAASTEDRFSSDWTNTVPSENGGTDISIYNITSTLSADGGTSNGLCTISFKVRINKWGTKSLTVDLDLDKLVSTS